MKTGPLIALLLAVALGLPAASAQVAAGKTDSATALALKRVSDRYALTKARISALLDQRRNPAPLPASLPNPFYQPTDLPVVETAPEDQAETVAPAVPDESDADTLAKFAGTLRISGLTVRNGVLLLTLNGTLCKTGDTIPLGVRDRTVYIQVLQVTPDELTIGLNAERQVVRIRK